MKRILTICIIATVVLAILFGILHLSGMFETDDNKYDYSSTSIEDVRPVTKLYVMSCIIEDYVYETNKVKNDNKSYVEAFSYIVPLFKIVSHNMTDTIQHWRFCKQAKIARYYVDFDSLQIDTIGVNVLGIKNIEKSIKTDYSYVSTGKDNNVSYADDDDDYWSNLDPVGNGIAINLQNKIKGRIETKSNNEKAKNKAIQKITLLYKKLGNKVVFQ